MDKRGVTSSQKKIISIFVGLLCIAFGAFPLLERFFNLSFIPDFLLSTVFLEVILMLGGIFLLYNSVNVGVGFTKFISIFAGGLLFFVGLIPLAIRFKLLNFLSFFATLTIPEGLFRGVLVFYGVYLIVDVFIMHPEYGESA